ncbi:MAG: hypothetical protein ACH350_04285 [Parachlamydiaceae bacterium]
MTHFYHLGNPFENSLGHLFSNRTLTSTELGRGAFQSIQHAQNVISKNQTLAALIFGLSSPIFLALSHYFAHMITPHINRYLGLKNPKQTPAQSCLTENIAFGCSFALLSYPASRILQSPMSHILLVAVTIGALATRLVLRHEASLQRKIVELNKAHHLPIKSNKEKEENHDDALQTQIAGHQATIKQLTESLETAKLQITLLKESEKDADGLIEQLQIQSDNTSDQFKTSIQDLKNQLNEATIDVKALEEKKCELEEVISELKAELQDHEKNFKSEKEELLTITQTNSDQVNTLLEQISTLQDEHAKQIDHLNEENHSLKSQLEEAERLLSLMQSKSREEEKIPSRSVSTDEGQTPERQESNEHSTQHKVLGPSPHSTDKKEQRGSFSKSLSKLFTTTSSEE